MYSPYASASHFIHYDWAAISKYSLSEKDGKYYPNFEDYEVDIRLLNPVLSICYHTLEEFIKNFPGHCIKHSSSSSLESIKSDKKIIAILDRMHHNYLHNLPLKTDIERFVQSI